MMQQHPQTIPPDFSTQGWTDQAAGSPFVVPTGVAVTRTFAVNPATRAVTIALQPLINIASYTISGSSTGLIYAQSQGLVVSGVITVPVLPTLDTHIQVSITANAFGPLSVSVVLAEQDVSVAIGAALSPGGALLQSAQQVTGLWRSDYGSQSPRDLTNHLLFDCGPFNDVGASSRSIFVNTSLNQATNILVGYFTNSGMTLNSGIDFYHAFLTVPIPLGPAPLLITPSGATSYGGTPIAGVTGNPAALNDPSERIAIYVGGGAIAPGSGLVEIVYHRRTG